MTVGIFPKAGLFAEPGLTIQGATQVMRRGTVLPLERWFVNSVMAYVRYWSCMYLRQFENSWVHTANLRGQTALCQVCMGALPRSSAARANTRAAAACCAQFAWWLLTPLLIIGIFPMAGRNAEPGLSVCGAMLAPIDICICQRLVTLPMIIGIFQKAGLNAEPGLII